MNDLLKPSELPTWFNIWWLINVIITVIFLTYWIIIDFRSTVWVHVFTFYAVTWGLWASKFRRKT